MKATWHTLPKEPPCIGPGEMRFKYVLKNEDDTTLAVIYGTYVGIYKWYHKDQRYDPSKWKWYGVILNTEYSEHFISSSDAKSKISNIMNSGKVTYNHQSWWVFNGEVILASTETSEGFKAHAKDLPLGTFSTEEEVIQAGMSHYEKLSLSAQKMKSFLEEQEITPISKG